MTVLAQASSGPLRCEIRESKTEGAVQLTGIVSSSVALSGRFQFSIVKSGTSGSSNINQGNPFAAEAGKEIYVGHVTINLGNDDRATIELSVSSDNGVECHANASIGR
ncbi:MAG: curli-like amyloid fiber formation chaperone CsgH [Bradyrhizobium sp.]